MSAVPTKKPREVKPSQFHPPILPNLPTPRRVKRTTLSRSASSPALRTHTSQTRQERHRVRASRQPDLSPGEKQDDPSNLHSIDECEPWPLHIASSLHGMLTLTYKRHPRMLGMMQTFAQSRGPSRWHSMKRRACLLLNLPLIRRVRSSLHVTRYKWPSMRNVFRPACRRACDASISSRVRPHYVLRLRYS